MAESDSIGKRIADHRKLKGWSQRQLAAATGYSLSQVEKIERGVRGLERYSTLHTFARVLGVDVTELTDPPRRRARKQLREHATVPDIRRVLTAIPPDVEDAPQRLVTDLRRDVQAAIARRESGSYTRFGEDFPVLLEELERAAASCPADAPVLSGLTAELLHAGSILLRRLGYVDLAWIAAQRARTAAHASDDPLLPVANDWHLAELHLRNGHVHQVSRLTEGAIRELAAGRPVADRPGAHSLHGTMHLVSAMVAAVRSDQPAVDEALRQAARAAERNVRNRDDYQSQFGPANVAIFGVSTAVEMDQGAVAVKRARKIDVEAIPSRERQVRHLIDVTRAYSLIRNDAAALQTIADAYKRAPEYVGNHVMGRQVIAELLERERRSITPGLRTLARKMGVA